MVITPATELDAINEIIGIIGQAPINSLEDEADIDSLNAQRILQGVSRELQSKGWSWNIEATNLSPDATTQKITFRDDWLRLEGASVVRREGYLYDLSNQTNLFKASVSVDIVRLIDFVDLPEVVRKYVTTKATKIFQARSVGAAELDREAREELQEAYQTLMEYELDFGAYNQIDSDPFIQTAMSR
ncbi:Phage tail fiber protein [Pseudomonas chlororaphis subsp. piscium]|uniref:phage tail protein n=1 Tax=Pseudomonas chlororaphis TaxID=587753 RepID=UPI000F57DE23|nr:phage tail protein [Pseudomonas chlororaphis]AZC49490.1 Phage tail fiber protein [Pseudomonas chlororaphis subsp. piscium]